MKKTKRVEVWHWWNGDDTRPRDAHRSEDEARRSTPFMALSSGYRLMRLVELPPGSVVVTREEAKVVRAARRYARTTGAWDRKRLTDAAIALRATKARKR